MSVWGCAGELSRLFVYDYIKVKFLVSTMGFISMKHHNFGNSCNTFLKQM